MGRFDSLKDKAMDAVGQHNDKVDEGIDKAADMANQRTDNKYEDKIDQGADRAKEALDNAN